MISFTNIIGMQVISVYSCEVIGSVLNLQLNSKHNKIINLIVSSPDDELTYLIPTHKIYNTQDCIMIKNTNALSVVSETEFANLINTTAFSLSGKNLGKIKDIILDNSWKISKIIADIEIEPQNLIKFDYSLAIVNDTSKKVTISNFKPKNAKFSTVSTLNQQVEALTDNNTPPKQDSSTTSLSIFTPKTITARLPSNFKNPI